MGYEIIWFPKAEERFAGIITYLENNWSEKEIKYFIQRTNVVLKFISQNPIMYRKSSKKNIYESLITKQNLMLYKIKGKRIEVLTFFDTRQNPAKKIK